MSSTITKKKSKAATLAQLQALVTGLQKELPNGSFTLMSTGYTTATLLPILQGPIAAITAVNTAQKSAEAALVDLAAEDAKSSPIIRALTRTLTTMYSNSPDTLALFALEAPRAPAPLSAAKRAAAVAKAKATREARGTKGAKQKALVTGNVTGVIITPITTPAAAQPVAAALSGSPTGPVGQ